MSNPRAFLDEKHRRSYMFTGSVAQADGTAPLPLTHAVVEKTIGASANAGVVPNGTPGQILTATLDTAGGGTWTVNPLTNTGFDSVELAGAGDTATFMYVDDTVGWILLGCYGATAPPVVNM